MEDENDTYEVGVHETAETGPYFSAATGVAHSNFPSADRKHVSAPFNVDLEEGLLEDDEQEVTTEPVEDVEVHDSSRKSGASRSKLPKGKNALHTRQRRPPKGSRIQGNQAGLKIGPRKNIEPTKEFKDIESRAVAAYINEDYEQAEELAKQAIGLNPEIFSAWALLSNIYSATGDDQKLITTLFVAPHLRFRDPDIWRDTADKLLSLVQDTDSVLKEAIYCYNRIMNLQRDSFEDRARRAALAYQAGDYNDVIKDCQKLLERQPQELEALRLLAMACAKLDPEPRRHHLEISIPQFEFLKKGQDEGVGLDEDYLSCIKEVGHAYLAAGLWQEALEYLQIYEQYPEKVDAVLFTSIAKAHSELAAYDKAEEYYILACAKDMQNGEARKGLTELMLLKSKKLTADASPTQKPKKSNYQAQIAPEDATFRVLDQLDGPEVDDARISAGMLKRPAPKPAPQANGLKRRKIIEPQAEDWSDAMEQLDALEQDHQGGPGANAEWLALAASAVAAFRSNERFWPSDRHKRLRDHLKDLAKDDDEDSEPKFYGGVAFQKWLDCLLKYALALVKAGDFQTALELCETTSKCIVWYHNKEDQLVIHLVWALCAVHAQDHKVLGQVTRYFITQDRFGAYGYQLFSIFHRLCGEGNTDFHASAMQKFMKRQLHFVESQVAENQRLAGDYGPNSSRDGLQNRDIGPLQVPVPLLVIYAHMLYSTRNYPMALDYYFRALRQEPDHPLILLFVGLSYYQQAMKRTCTDRQMQIARGTMQLQKYYRLRKASTQLMERQEGEMNFARAQHLLGQAHLAIPYYERCLEIGREIKKSGTEEERAANFAIEAAYVLKGLMMNQGAENVARKITAEWLVV